MVINKYHGSYNLSRRSGSVQYIVVHYTAGTGSALNNCIYFSGGNRNASADYFIDDSGIWEYNDPGSGYYSWAVGDGKGKYGITNNNSCSIEVVNTGGPFSDAEIEHLKELVQHLMSRFGVPASRVVRHYDASRKFCPYYYVDANRWSELHSIITNSTSTLPSTGNATTTPSTIITLDEDGWWGPKTTKRLQQYMGTVMDSIISGQDSGDFARINRGGLQTDTWKTGKGGSTVIRALQAKIGTNADGFFGRNSCLALQRYLGTTQDGYVSGPSNMVKELQRRLNNNNL